MVVSMNKSQAISEINSIFGKYGSSPNIPAGTGKIYELYCLGLLLKELDTRGFTLSYHGPYSATFKAGPGLIKTGDPHFDLEYNGVTQAQIYLNIEFQTLGSVHAAVNDRSCRHELDIVIVEDGVTGRPAHNEILMGVECKSTANFGKSIIKETLGVRREMTLLRDFFDSELTQLNSGWGVQVNCDPLSEYWLCFVDPKGTNYSASAEYFGVELKHWDP